MMNISALSAQAPPFDYTFHTTNNNNNATVNNNSNNDSSNKAPFYDLNKVDFRRDSSAMPSPPELMLDSEEDEESVVSSSSHRGSYIPDLYMHHHHQHHKSNRKSAPHRSPSIEDHHTPFDNSVVFQLDVNSNLNCKSRIISQQQQQPEYIRPMYYNKREQHQQQQQQQHFIKPVRIQLPKIHHHIIKNHNNVPSWQKKILNDVSEESISMNNNKNNKKSSSPATHQRKTSGHVGRRSSPPSLITAANGTVVVKHASSGRPSRVKGPCQACQETSDGCMRKAFNWPFSTGSQYNDKGKPFVYLCNKCGLRYNKSGGCVCRHCKWVLCKEEKRKAMQLIDEMRRNRPDGVLDPNEDIVNFACAPKYWSCGKAWKVGWVLNSQHDDDDSDTNF